MGTTTPRLGMYKAAGGEALDVVTGVNNNLDKLDLDASIRVVTSGTRPSTPFTGQRIYETDTLKILIWDGSAWQIIGGNVPTCLCRLTSNQSIPNASDTLITFNSLDYLSDSTDFSLSSGVLTINKVGIYLVSANVGWESSTGTGRRRIAGLFNTGSNKFMSAEVTKDSATSFSVSTVASRLIRVSSVGDEIRIFANQSTGGSLNVVGPDTSTIAGATLGMHYIRPL